MKKFTTSDEVRMPSLSSHLDRAADALVRLDLDDLPAVAGLHEQFLSLAGLIRQSFPIAADWALKCADLIQRLILNEEPDKATAVAALESSLSRFQTALNKQQDLALSDLPQILGGNLDPKPVSGLTATPAPESKVEAEIPAHGESRESYSIQEFSQAGRRK